MKNKWIRILLTVFQILPFWTSIGNAGEPCSHIMICCKGCNKGVSFLVNGEWNASHDYGDIDQVRDIMHNIKDAGINTVIIDMTNPSQWTYLYPVFEPMVENIEQVCIENNMQFFMLIGGQLPDATKEECGIPLETDAFEFWNGIAEKIWVNWAQDQTYRKYGFGDDRPMILAFLPSEWYWRDYNTRPDEYKTYLSKFYIGTTQVNDPITPGETDGWGYRKSIGNPSGTIRYTSPNGGIGPDTWHKISPEAFRAEVEWANEAGHYSIYGSYDDACDAIFWGIADTRNSLADHNKYPVDDPFVYYTIIKETLNPGEQTTAPAFLYSRPGDQIVRLDWADNVETEFSGKYNVYRSQQQGGPYSLISEISQSNFTPGEIKWPAFQMEYESSGEWITAIADNSAMENKKISLMFVDPIGNTSGIGKNFELDYIYLSGYLHDDSLKIQHPYDNINIPGTIEFENFDLGGVNRAYVDSDFENIGNTFRTDESVDIGEKNTGEYFVGWCNTNEWLENTVNMNDFGKFRASISIPLD